MVDISKEISFDKFCADFEGIQTFVEKAAKEFYDELPADEKIKKPFVEKSFDDFIIVIGLPVVDKEKFEKMKKYFCSKILVKLGLDKDVRNDPTSDRVWGWDENKENTNGCVILDFKTAQLAEYAINGTPGDSKKVGLNGLKFDGKHTLIATSFADYNKVFNAPSNFVAPKLLTHKELSNWQVGNEEHYTFQNGNKVFFNKMFHLNKTVEKAIPNNADSFIELSGQNKIQWSQSGRYLIEFLPEGFQLYGGEKMEKLNFFAHKNVKNVEFNSTEEYVLSYNGTVVDNEDSDNYIVWSVSEVSKIRTFKAAQDDRWGGMKFNHAGNLVGRITAHQLHVYKLPEMQILPQTGSDERAPIMVRNIQSFSWVKNTNLVVTASYPGTRDYDQEDINRNPTKLALFELPSRRELKWKSISWEVNDVEFTTEANGKYIIAVMKKMKNKKVVSTLVHIANLQKRNPVEITDLEFSANEAGLLKSFHFQENTGKLGMVFTQKQTYETKIKQADFNVHLMDIAVKGQNIKLEKICEFNQKKTPEVQWSSNGTFFALINKDKESSQQGILELGFLSKNKEKKFQAEIFKSYDNLSYMTYASWDSTGRLMLTGSDSTNSYHIYNALGECLYKETVNKQGLQFLKFRPRSQILITNEKKAQISDKIKPNNDRWNHWVEEDEKIVNRKEWEEKQKQEQQKKKFQEYLRKKKAHWNETKQERIKLRGFDEEDFSECITFQVVEREEILETGIVDK